MLSANLIHGQLAITEFENQPNNANAAAEFIEIFNYSTSTVDLSGWTLSDGGGVVHTFSGSLTSGAYMIVTRAESTFETEWSIVDTGTQVVGAGSMVLANGGEPATLTNGSFTWAVDTLSTFGTNGSLVLDDMFDFSTVSATGVNLTSTSYEFAIAGVNGAVTSASGDIGSPLAGPYTAVPEPSTVTLVSIAIGTLVWLRRRNLVR